MIPVNIDPNKRTQNPINPVGDRYSRLNKALGIFIVIKIYYPIVSITNKSLQEKFLFKIITYQDMHIKKLTI